MEIPGYESIPPPTFLTIEAVKAAVCRMYELKPKRLVGPERCRGVARPRAVAMYLARRLTSASYLEIGAAFDRHHVTVMASVRKIERLMGQHAALGSQVGTIVQALLEPTRKAA